MLSDRRVVVLNFGAAVLAADALRSASVGRVRDAVAQGQAVVVVCSPLATPAGGEVSFASRFIDALSAAGVRSVALTRRQIGALPGEPLAEVQLDLLRELLDQSIVAVVSGAMPHGVQRGKAREHEGDSVAFTLAHRLNAPLILYHESTGGVFAADPKRVGGAAPLRTVSHLEMMEIAASGESVVSAITAERARAKGTSYDIRSVTHNRGTSVREDARVDVARGVIAVAITGEIALFNVRIPNPAGDHQERALDDLLRTLAERGLAIQMLQFVGSGARFTCERALVPKIREALDSLHLRARCIEKCSRLSIVGSGARDTPGIFYRILRTLAGAHIDVLHFADSNVTITVIVAEAQALLAERTLHDDVAVADGSNLSGSMQFDVETGRLQVRGRTYRLGERQSRLLDFFISNTGRPIEAETGAQALFGSAGPEDVSAFRVHVHNLRKKIEAYPNSPRYLVTVPNKGYLFTR